MTATRRQEGSRCCSTDRALEKARSSPGCSASAVAAFVLRGAGAVGGGARVSAERAVLPAGADVETVDTWIAPKLAELGMGGTSEGGSPADNPPPEVKDEAAADVAGLGLEVIGTSSVDGAGTSAGFLQAVSASPSWSSCSGLRAPPGSFA